MVLSLSMLLTCCMQTSVASVIHLVLGYGDWKEAGLYLSTVSWHGQMGTSLNFTDKKLIQVSGDSWL